jgi:hypothetical protein
MRDKKIPYKRQKEEFRVLALGKSPVMGERIRYGERVPRIHS